MTAQAPAPAPAVIGWEGTIELPQSGKLTTSSAMTEAVIARIACVYDVPLHAVVIEPHLTGSERRARVLVLTHNPLQEDQPFTGPSLDMATGYLNAGVHADGTTARWRLWTPGSGANHGLIAGTTGSGKSGLLNVLCTEIHHSDRHVLWLADPDGGESMPDWQDAADWHAGELAEIRRQLQAAERIMDGRFRDRAGARWTDELGRERRGVGKFDPTPELPQLVVIVDESPDVLLDPECARIIARIGKKGRKVGISVIIVTQVPSVSELGGDLTIRSMISSTNIAMFRTSDKLSKQMGLPADLPVDPASLPIAWPDGSTTAGLGYLIGAGGTRVSSMRAYFVEDPYESAVKPAGGKLDDHAVAAAGKHYATWRDRRDSDHQDEPGTAGAVGATGDTPLVAAGGGMTEAGWQALTALINSGVLGADEQTTQLLNQALVNAPTPATANRGGTVKDRILCYLEGREEPVRSGVIAHDLDVPLPTVSKSLRRLCDAGQVTNPSHGRYALPGTPGLRAVADTEQEKSA